LIEISTLIASRGWAAFCHGPQSAHLRGLSEAGGAWRERPQGWGAFLPLALRPEKGSPESVRARLCVLLVNGGVPDRGRPPGSQIARVCFCRV